MPKGSTLQSHITLKTHFRIRYDSKHDRMLHTLLLHVRAIAFHAFGLSLIKCDNAQCFHSRACTYPRDYHHIILRGVDGSWLLYTSDHALAMLMKYFKTSIIEIVVEGSSWDACLAVITANSCDWEGRQENWCVPGAPETHTCYVSLCCFILWHLYLLNWYSVSSPCTAADNVESCLRAKFADNCFINSNLLPLFLTRHLGPNLCKTWQ